MGRSRPSTRRGGWLHLSSDPTRSPPPGSINRRATAAEAGRFGLRRARTRVSVPPIRPLPDNQRSSRLRATRATRVVFEVEENASDVSDEADICPPQSRSDCVSQVPVAARRVREFLREGYTLAFRHEHWHVGIVDAPLLSFLVRASRPDVHWLPLPDRGTYPAAPIRLP